MTIPVTGSTGTIGSQVVQRLAGQGARIRALVRGDASKVKIPAGVEPVQGDITDVASLRRCGGFKSFPGPGHVPESNG
jgi:uncharacterized protein YbjT (DUF2867 family)